MTSALNEIIFIHVFVVVTNSVDQHQTQTSENFRNNNLSFRNKWWSVWWKRKCADCNVIQWYDITCHIMQTKCNIRSACLELYTERYGSFSFIFEELPVILYSFVGQTRWYFRKSSGRLAFRRKCYHFVLAIYVCLTSNWSGQIGLNRSCSPFEA